MERTTRGQAVVLGVALILVGVVYLGVEFISPYQLFLDFKSWGWPIFIVVPGLALVGIGLAAQDLAPVTIPGAVITVTGIVLIVQNAFDLFATWAYVWALIVPGAVGAGMWLQGTVGGGHATRSAGWRTLSWGVILFLLGAVFFEGIVHVSGQPFGAGRVLLPLMLIAIGIWVLIRRGRANR